jgi:hypothetical protein
VSNHTANHDAVCGVARVLDGIVIGGCHTWQRAKEFERLLPSIP